jgi:hypothetical protein
MTPTTFDEIEVHRPELAKSYLSLMLAQPGRPLALFAFRRVGKTFFLLNDLAPAAVEEKMVPVYVDLWLSREDPLGAINNALLQAFEAKTIPKGMFGRVAKTEVKKVSVLGTGMDFGDSPKPSDLPAEPEFRLDTLIPRLAKACGGKVLLMLDEVQMLADHDGKIIATVRAVLTKHKAIVAAVLTGSSREGLVALTATERAPMYQFTQSIDFPYLDDTFLKALAQHFSRVHKGKSLDLDAMSELFAQIGYKPGLMKDIITAMSAEGMTNVSGALHHFLNLKTQREGFEALIARQPIIDRYVLSIMANGRPVYGGETLAMLTTAIGTKATIGKVRQSVARLVAAGHVAKIGDGYVFNDSMLLEFILMDERLRKEA